MALEGSCHGLQLRVLCRHCNHTLRLRRLACTYVAATLNAMVSVLAIASKSSVVFVVAIITDQLKGSRIQRRDRRLEDFQTLDHASRGPLGALTALATARSGLLASRVVAITLLLVAFDHAPVLPGFGHDAGQVPV